MKEAKGFVAEDGTFFAKREEAEYYEARQALVVVLDKTEIDEGKYVDPEKFIEVLSLTHQQAERLINAYKAATEYAQEYEAAAAAERHRRTVSDTGQNHAQGNGAAPSQNRPYRGSRENPPGVQQLKTGGHEPMPNVGSGEQPEEL